jgi:hypothetical protein
MELTLSLVFALQLSFAWSNLVSHFTQLVQQKVFTKPVLEDPGLVIGSTVLVLLLALLQIGLALRFTRSVHAVTSGVREGVWRMPDPDVAAPPIVGVAAMASIVILAWQPQSDTSACADTQCTSARINGLGLDCTLESGVETDRTCAAGYEPRTVSTAANGDVVYTCCTKAFDVAPSIYASFGVFLVAGVAIAASGWCRQRFHFATDRPIAPRRLSKQAAFLTGRFAPHAPGMQLKIWKRQCLLFAVDLAAAAIPDSDNFGYVYAIIDAAIILNSLRNLRVGMPYAYPYQNKLQTCLDISVIVLLTMACIYSEASANVVLQVLMFIVLGGSIFGGVALSMYGLRTAIDVAGSRFEGPRSFSDACLISTEELEKASALNDAPKPAQAQLETMPDIKLDAVTA